MLILLVLPFGLFDLLAINSEKNTFAAVFKNISSASGFKASRNTFCALLGQKNILSIDLTLR